jgi:alkylation response protein AidB-like acyl-CoA dehydrogenase
VDVDLAPDMLALRARARAFVDREVIPRERELSHGYQLPPDVRAQLEAAARDADLWNINVPAEFGGRGYGLLARAMI